MIKRDYLCFLLQRPELFQTSNAQTDPDTLGGVVAHLDYVAEFPSHVSIQQVLLPEGASNLWIDLSPYLTPGNHPFPSNLVC